MEWPFADDRIHLTIERAKAAYRSDSKNWDLAAKRNRKRKKCKNIKLVLKKIA